MEYLHCSRAEAEAQRGGITCLKSHSKTGAELELERRCPDINSGAGDAFSLPPRTAVLLHRVLPARASCGPLDRPEPRGRRLGGESKGPSRWLHDSQGCSRPHQTLSSRPATQTGQASLSPSAVQGRRLGQE